MHLDYEDARRAIQSSAVDPMVALVSTLLSGQLPDGREHSLHVNIMDPAAFYASPEGGTSLFVAAANEVPVGAANVTTPHPEAVIGIVENAGPLGVFNARTTISTNLRGITRRRRGAKFTPKAGAQPLAITNRGGGANQSEVRVWRGDQVAMQDWGSIIRSDFTDGYDPQSIEVRGSAVLRPGIATVFSFTPQPTDQERRLVPTGNLEYLWWERPLVREQEGHA